MPDQGTTTPVTIQITLNGIPADPDPIVFGGPPRLAMADASKTVTAYRTDTGAVLTGIPTIVTMADPDGGTLVTSPLYTRIAAGTYRSYLPDPAGVYGLTYGFYAQGKLNGRPFQFRYFKAGPTSAAPSPSTQPGRELEVSAQQVVATAPINYGMITPGSSVRLLARLADRSGESNITQSDVSTISVTITDLMTGVAGSPISVDPVVSIASNTEPGQWPIDGQGPNLSIGLFGSNFPASQTTYQVVASIVTTDSSIFEIIWQLQTALTL